MSPQSDEETRQRIVERSELLIQESRQLVEAAQTAMRTKDSQKHRDTVGAARELNFQANNNPPTDPVSTIPSKLPTRYSFFGQCGILLEIWHPTPLRSLVEGELHDRRFVSVADSGPAVPRSHCRRGGIVLSSRAKL